MTNQKLISEYREQLLKVHAITVSIVSFVELLAYFIFVYFGLETLSWSSTYLWLHVMLPICINALAHVVARSICHLLQCDERVKNNSVIYAAIVTSFVVSMFHRDYFVTSCAFVFPIILSAMYNDKSILRQSLLLAIVLLSATVAMLFAEQKLDLTTALNVMVLYGVIAVSYLSGDMFIKFSNKNYAIIEEQALVNSHLEDKIDMDQMTDLYNHEAFYERLEETIAKTKNCCLAMIDIDDFKLINDEYGHNDGDTVLITLANILKSCCGEGDSACRYGGEEFALIFYEKNLDEAEFVIKEALKQFSTHCYEFTDKRLTFSCGITQYNKTDTIESFFERADDYLYKSKRNGKNQITSRLLS